jgi:hypothetical protein
MGWEYEPGTVFEAEDLYCVDRLPMRKVSEQTEVPESTLWRWSAKYGWADKREEMRREQSAIRMNMIRLRSKLIEECLNVGGDERNPMNVFAAAKMEEVAQKAEDRVRMSDSGRRTSKEESVAPCSSEKEIQPREIKSEEDAAQALEEALTLKLSIMVQDPKGLDVKAIKGVREAMQMIAEMRGKDEEEKRSSGFSAESVQEIISKFFKGQK